MTTKNIYIDALKFGVNKMQNGVSFNETKEHLITLGWEIDVTFEQYLRYWFNTHYYNVDFEVKVIAGGFSELWPAVQNLKQFDSKKVIMSAKAYEMLQDYEKLQDARKSANTAKWIAIVSILITLVLSAIQIVLQVISINR